ncbi:MAG: substrate-binding domain-containing protein, partial [Armatimonadota bacterium]
MLRRCLLCAAIVGAAVTFVAGCKQRAPSVRTPVASPLPTEVGPKASDEHYYLVAVSVNSAYWRDAEDGLKDRAAQLGVKAEMVGPNGPDAKEQADTLAEIVSKKPAGVLIAPAEPDALKPGIDAAMDAGVPVITIDTDSPDSKRYFYMGTPNYESGVAVGELLAEAMGYRGKAGISWLASGQWNIKERRRGVLDALKKYDIPVVAQVNDEAKADVSVRVNSDMINAHPEITGIAGLDGESGSGIARAVIEAGRKGEIKIVAFDRNEDMLDYVEDGTIYA